MKNILYIVLFFGCSIYGQHQTTLLVSQQQFANESGAVYLLDTYTNATSAISFRKLKSTAVNCCEIRRSSDNALAVVVLEDSGQISLSSLIVAGGTLGSWIGSDDGYLRTMYDQSGNGNNFQQTTNTLQWLLISSGVLITNTNGDISADTQTGIKPLSLTGLSYTGIRTLFSVVETTDTVGLLYVADSNTFSGYLTDGENGVPDLNSGTCSYYADSSIIANTRDDLYINWATGVPVLTTTYIGDSTNYANFSISGYPAGGFELSMKFTELVLFNSDETSSQSSIETNINTFYTI